MYPKVSIIILNWNGWRDTIECLESVYQINYPNYEVIVVDNGSTDDSIEKIKEYCEGKIKVESKFFKYNPNNKPIKVFEVSESIIYKNKKFKFSNKELILIKNKKNYGYTGGNNIGIKFSLKFLNAKYTVILNNDTVVDVNFLKELVKIAERDDKIGIVGPKVLYYSKPNVINSAGTKINWRLGICKNIGAGKVDKGQYNKIVEVDAVFGACMLIKNRVFYDVGYFDESFFILLEETDFCTRARKKGYSIFYQPSSIVYHKAGASRTKISLISLYYSHRNRILFLKKHNKLTHSTILLLLCGGFISVLYYLLKYKDARRAICIIKAYYNGLNQR